MPVSHGVGCKNITQRLVDIMSQVILQNNINVWGGDLYINIGNVMRLHKVLHWQRPPKDDTSDKGRA